MLKNNVHIILFTAFALWLPFWGMQSNGFDRTGVHTCAGDCYQQWREVTGGAVAMASAQALARSEASPEELGKQLYTGCIACHGPGGEGGVGPSLQGQPASETSGKLVMYKNGETRGRQSALMWSQAAALSDSDIDNLAAFIATL
jgi:cytochrome c553